MLSMKAKVKKEIKHRDVQVVGMVGRARAFVDRQKKQKSDVTGRKAKHKERD